MCHLGIDKFCKNKELYIKRKQRLLGQDGQTKKALEILTNTHIVIEGKSVVIIGPYEGVQKV